MDEKTQYILQSDLPNALQLTWIAMWGASSEGVYGDSLAELGRSRSISRQAARKQVQRLMEMGFAEKIGQAYRLTTDSVNPSVDDDNPEVDSDNPEDDNPKVDDVNPEVDNDNPSEFSPEGKKKSSTKEKTQPPLENHDDDHRAGAKVDTFEDLPELDESPFSFLDQKQERNLDRIQDAYQWIIEPPDPKRRSERTEKIARRLLSGPKSNRKKVPITGVSAQVKNHPLPAVIAAWVISETKSSPFDYAQALLSDDDSGPPFYEDRDFSRHDRNGHSEGHSGSDAGSGEPEPAASEYDGVAFGG